MHICCSNCSIYPLQSLLGQGARIKGLWFNPNIHPYQEYSARLLSVRKLAKLWDLDVEYIDAYPLDYFLGAVVGRGADRCSICYEIRLEKTAETARQMGMDCFSTSLLASPYQKFDKIVQLGNSIGARYGIPFHAEDMRTGWRLSKSLSREFDLYRQKYCGCVYSEMERFMRTRDK